MRIIDLIVFKSPAKVDWEATDRAIAKFIREHPDSGSPAENAMWHADVQRDVERFVKRFGVRRLYAAVEAEKRANEAGRSPASKLST